MAPALSGLALRRRQDTPNRPSRPSFEGAETRFRPARGCAYSPRRSPACPGSCRGKVRRPSASQLGGNLRRKIGARALDALAQRKAREPGDPDRRAEIAGGGFDHLGDLALLIDDEDLLAQHRTFALERRRRHRSDVEIERIRRGDVHRQLLAEIGELFGRSLRGERDNDADPADPGPQSVVHIGGDDAFIDREPLRATQYQILADRRDQMNEFLRDAAAGARIARPPQRLEGAIAGERERAKRAHEALEQVVARDKIGLRIDLDDGARAPLRHHPDEPLGGQSPGLFGGGSKPFLAQPVDGPLEVPAALGESPLAIHHPGPGLLAQFLDQSRGYHLGHPVILSLSSRAARRLTPRPPPVRLLPPPRRRTCRPSPPAAARPGRRYLRRWPPARPAAHRARRPQRDRSRDGSPAWRRHFTGSDRRCRPARNSNRGSPRSGCAACSPPAPRSPPCWYRSRTGCRATRPSP